VKPKPDIDRIVRDFPRRVPIFPLPEAVLFPGAVLPLHIFEPRYREMLEDALASDRLIAMALLKQCSREEYESRPPFHETVCVGRIVRHEALADGRSNIALLGISAGRAQEAADDRPYRTAEVLLLEDELDAFGSAFRARLERAYAISVQGPEGLAGFESQLLELLDEDRIPAALINTCALTAPILPQHKLQLLEERSIARRLERLIEFLERPWQWN